MSSVEVEHVGIDNHVKFGDSRSNRARDIRLPHFVTDEVMRGYKVITTMVIRLLHNPTRCAQCVVADVQPLGLGYVGVGDGHIR